MVDQRIADNVRRGRRGRAFDGLAVTFVLERQCRLRRGGIVLRFLDPGRRRGNVQALRQAARVKPVSGLQRGDRALPLGAGAQVATAGRVQQLGQGETLAAAGFGALRRQFMGGAHLGRVIVQPVGLEIKPVLRAVSADLVQRLAPRGFHGLGQRGSVGVGVVCQQDVQVRMQAVGPHRHLERLEFTSRARFLVHLVQSPVHQCVGRFQCRHDVRPVVVVAVRQGQGHQAAALAVLFQCGEQRAAQPAAISRHAGGGAALAGPVAAANEVAAQVRAGVVDLDLRLVRTFAKGAPAAAPDDRRAAQVDLVLVPVASHEALGGRLPDVRAVGAVGWLGWRIPILPKATKLIQKTLNLGQSR